MGDLTYTAGARDPQAGATTTRVIGQVLSVKAHSLPAIPQLGTLPKQSSLGRTQEECARMPVSAWAPDVSTRRAGEHCGAGARASNGGPVRQASCRKLLPSRQTTCKACTATEGYKLGLAMINTKSESFRVGTEQNQGLSNEMNLTKVGVSVSAALAHYSLYFSLRSKESVTEKSCKEANRNGN